MQEFPLKTYSQSFMTPTFSTE